MGFILELASTKWTADIDEGQRKISLTIASGGSEVAMELDIMQIIYLQDFAKWMYMECPRPPFSETMSQLRDAFNGAWDDIDDVDAYVRELRGDESDE